MTGGAAARDTFRSLWSRNFRLFWFGQLTSQAGTWMQTIAVIWVVLRLTDNGVALGLVTAAQFLPVLLIGAWGGVIADRVDRHRFMFATQIAFTAVAVAFSLLILIDQLTILPIFVLSALIGVITALDNPTRKALVVDLVPIEDVPNAVALNSAMMTGSRVFGPSLAGVLITTVGVEWCFIVNTVSYFVVLGALAMMRKDEIRSSPRVVKAKGQLREGLRYVWSNPELRHAIFLLTVVGTLAFEYQVTLPLLAERTLDAGAGGFTMLYTFMSVGSVTGALTMARRRDVDLRFLVRSAWGLFGATCLLAAAPTLPLAVVAIIPVGMFTIMLAAGLNSVVQLRADPAMRGRALALTTVVFLGSTPIGGPIAGWVAEHYGAPASLMMGGIGTALAATWVGRQLPTAPQPEPDPSIGRVPQKTP